ncbi:MAG: hypothetical protein AAFV33_12680 [Chloroflexota bacterium]
MSDKNKEPEAPASGEQMSGGSGGSLPRPEKHNPIREKPGKGGGGGFHDDDDNNKFDTKPDGGKR